MEVLGIFEKLEEWSELLKEFMVNNGNIIVFVGLFIAGLALFVIGYESLHKEN